MDAIDLAIERFARSSRPMAKTRPKHDVSGAPFMRLCEHHNRLCWSTANCEPEPEPIPDPDEYPEDHEKVVVVLGENLVQWILCKGGTNPGDIYRAEYYTVFLLGPDELVNRYFRMAWPTHLSDSGAYNYAVENAKKLADEYGAEYHELRD
jgi:hypothetical protein